MDAYIIGNLTGRLLISALLVYIILLCFNRFQLKTALLKMKHPLAIVSTFVLFILGIAGNAVADERAKRPFSVTAVPEAGLQIYIPDRPAWHWETQKRVDTYSVVLTTPENYYPPASMDIVQVPTQTVAKGSLPIVAMSALKTVRKKLGAVSPFSADNMRKVSYGNIVGYEEIIQVNNDGHTFEAKSFMGIFPSGHPISFFLVTGEGQLSHIEPMIKKIFSNTAKL